jgi:hypothetical protein
MFQQRFTIAILARRIRDSIACMQHCVIAIIGVACGLMQGHTVSHVTHAKLPKGDLLNIANLH